MWYFDKSHHPSPEGHSCLTTRFYQRSVGRCMMRSPTLVSMSSHSPLQRKRMACLARRRSDQSVRTRGLKPLVTPDGRVLEPGHAWREELAARFAHPNVSNGPT